ncbi:MAG: MFS transporter [Pseudomonadota bacterium]
MLSFLRENIRWLAAGMLLTFCSSFGQTFFIAIYAQHIQTDFGLSDGSWGLIYTTGTAASAIVMIWAGSLTDRFRVRHLASVVLPALALACLAMAFLPAVWALPIVVFALRLFGQGMTSQIAMVAMARWFDKNRGKALSLASLGFSIGEALLPLLFVALMRVVDWQVLWGVAALIAVTILPLVWILLRQERTPQSARETLSATGMDNRHWSRAEVMRHWLFWSAVPCIIGISAFVTAFFFQQTHIVEIKGWQHIDLVALFPVYTGTAVLTVVLAGLATDRWGTAPMMGLFQLPLAAAFIAMSYSESLAGAALALVLMGMTTGCNSTLPSAFWAEFFGTRHIGSIKALAAAIMVLGSAVGPGLSGVLIDFGVGFERQLWWFGVYFLAASAILGLGVRRAGQVRFASHSSFDA